MPTLLKCIKCKNSMVALCLPQEGIEQIPDTLFQIVDVLEISQYHQLFCFSCKRRFNLKDIIENGKIKPENIETEFYNVKNGFYFKTKTGAARITPFYFHIILLVSIFSLILFSFIYDHPMRYFCIFGFFMFSSFFISDLITYYRRFTFILKNQQLEVYHGKKIISRLYTNNITKFSPIIVYISNVRFPVRYKSSVIILKIRVETTSGDSKIIDLEELDYFKSLEILNYLNDHFRRNKLFK